MGWAIRRSGCGRRDGCASCATPVTPDPVVRSRTPSENTKSPGEPGIVVDLAGGLSKLAPPLARLSLMHRAIRLRARRGVRREESYVRQQTRVSGEVLLSAEAQYAAGETLRTIATEVGVSRQRLASLLRERGVRLRRTAPSDAEVQEMVRRYADGESLERVGARVGFSAGTVRNHLIAAGVLLRDPQGRER